MNDLTPGIIYLIVFVLIYFIPSFVAFGRERNGGPIVLNIFLGWTVIGWVVALAWAASLVRRNAPQTPTPANATKQTTESAKKEDVLCPYCAEEIKPAAIVCKHCGRDLPDKPIEGPDHSAARTN